MEKEINSTPRLESVNGVLRPPHFDKNLFISAINYKPKPGEVVIVTYPKCGTTWMQQIVMLILRKGKISNDPLDFVFGCPFIDKTGADDVNFMSKVVAVRTHIPFRSLQFSPQAKYIYVARNPFDCCVSFYYHMQTLKQFANPCTFDMFFENFIKGELSYGNYFDHLLDGYNRKNNENIYFTTYEALKKDSRGEILKIAKFIGEEYEKIMLEDPKVLEDVLHYSSFDYMKKHINESFVNILKGNVDLENTVLPSGYKAILDQRKKQDNKETRGSEFVRKGIIGDWKNHFTSDQRRRLEEKIAEKTTGSDVMNLWKDLL